MAVFQFKMKREIVPDENTKSTPLEIMSTTRSIIWDVVLVVCVVISCIASFATPNTIYSNVRSSNTGLAHSKISHRAQFKRLNAINSFSILGADLVPAFMDERTINVSVDGVVRYYDSSLKEVDSVDVNFYRKLKCFEGSCEEIILAKNNFINYDSVSVVASIEVVGKLPSFYSVRFTNTSLRSEISISAFVLISIVTVILSIVLIFIVPRRMYPTRKDHWSIIYLGLATLCIDGPWLILKYYAADWFSSMYDIMPELYHIVFVMFMMSFFNAMTHGWANRILGSWTISIIIGIGLLAIIVLQAIVTGLMPLNAVSVFIGNSLLRIPIYTLTLTMHLVIVAIIIMGLISIQISNDWTLLLVALSISIVEILDIIRVCLRFWAPRSQLGFSFAADVFYILVANLITAFYLYADLPIEQTMAVEEKEKVTEHMIAEAEL